VTNAAQAVSAAAPCGRAAVLEQTFEQLSSAGVTWSRLRDEPAPLTHGDVDLLVAPADAAKARALLLDAGFAELPSLGRGTHRFFIAYDREARVWHELDLVTELAYGPHFVLRTDAAAGCLARRRPSGAAFVLDDGDAFWTLMLHCLLDRQDFRVDCPARLVELARAADGESEFASLVDESAPRAGLAAELLESVRREDWSTVEALGRCLKQSWLAQLGMRGRALRFGRRLLRGLEKPIALRHRRGLSVAVLGVDGSGKSTLVSGLAQGVPFGVRCLYMGLWSDRGRLARNTATRALRALVRPAGIWLLYLRGLAHRLLGRLVVFDRYTYDAFLPPGPPFARLKRAYFSVVARSCPAPDLVVLLDVQADTAAERKPDEDRESLARSRRALLALDERLAQLEVVDASRDSEAVRAEVTELIWSRYRNRWEPRA
jgi:thymidylate kinase